MEERAYKDRNGWCCRSQNAVAVVVVAAGQNLKNNTLGTGRRRGETGGRGESMGKSEKAWLPMPEEKEEGSCASEARSREAARRIHHVKS